jgi:hypothetical protein
MSRPDGAYISVKSHTHLLAISLTLQLLLAPDAIFTKSAPLKLNRKGLSVRKEDDDNTATAFANRRVALPRKTDASLRKV